MPLSRNCKDLIPPFQEIVRKWLTRCIEEDISVTIYCTLRTNDEQAALYAQGREDITQVNKLRRFANLPAIGDRENSRKVTDSPSGYSWHNYGCAIDFFPLDLQTGRPDWNCNLLDPDDHYYEAVRIMVKEVDPYVIWGGSFLHFKDYGHFEYHPGLTITEAREIKSLGGKEGKGDTNNDAIARRIVAFTTAVC